jgi:protein-tyrosine phosphatase
LEVESSGYNEFAELNSINVLGNQRVLQLTGVRNLRDVGGYPTRDGRQTRWRTLYRSDCLDRLDSAGQSWLLNAGLRSVIDIRDHGELAERPNVFATSSDVAYRHLPLFDGPPPDDLQPDFRNGYLREIDLLGARLVTLITELLTSGALPAVVHCAAGKDRTGVAVAVVLDAVGTERSAIAEDYALSQTCLGPTYLSETREWVERRGWDWAVWEHTVDTPPERMLATLAYIDQRFEGVERYLLEHGLPSPALADLREALTEPITA